MAVGQEKAQARPFGLPSGNCAFDPRRHSGTHGRQTGRNNGSQQPKPGRGFESRANWSSVGRRGSSKGLGWHCRHPHQCIFGSSAKCP